MNKTLEKQLLTVIEVIKKIQLKLDNNTASLDTEISEVRDIINDKDKTTNTALNGILKTLEQLNSKVDIKTHQETLTNIKSELKAIETKLQQKIDNKQDIVNVKEEIENIVKEYATKTDLDLVEKQIKIKQDKIDIDKEIKKVVKDYVSKNELETELKDVLKEVKTETIVETIREEIKSEKPNIEIGKVETIESGSQAEVKIRQVNDIYYLDFYIPKGMSGHGSKGAKGESGIGIPIGGTTNQVLAKNSSTNYDTKWVDNTGGTGTSDHSALTNLDYATSGHTGFQPAGTYLTSETDPVFTAWDKDYDDLTNKPTIPTDIDDLTDSTGIIPTDVSDLTDTTNIIPDAYTLPTATTSVLGGVKIDGTTIAITDGVISATTGGGGDVTGPTGATADNIVLFNSTTGKIIKDSGKKLSDYQDALVSGTNIKTVNSTDLLGSGNIVISDGADGQEVMLQTSATHVQWKYTDDVSWTDLIALADLKGDTGATGAAGSNGTNGTDGTDGDDGTEIELQVSATHIQWRYVGAATWTDLILLSAITGPAGSNGTNGLDGSNGTDGVGITSIDYTSTLGLVDTYTITYTDNSTDTFDVTNGADGSNGTNGTNGSDGTDGSTPYIQGGYWYIDGTSTGVLATGPKGDKGDPGSQGIQGIQGPAGANGTNGTDGNDAAEITSAAFDGNDIKFIKDDATTFSLTDAKITLKGEKGDTGLTGATGSTGATGAAGANGADGTDGADGLTTSVNGVTQVAGAITIDPDDLDDSLTAHKFVTATDLTNLGNLSGTNSGDNAVNTNYSGLTQYTDEMAQDAVGGMVDGSLTYTDGTPELKVTNPVSTETIGFTITAGTTPKTLTVPLDASVSGTNTGDQNLSGYVTTTTDQVITGQKAISNNKLAIIGTDTGTNVIATANTGTDVYTNTLPAKTGTIAMTTDLHSAVTVTDTDEIDLTLTGQDIKADIKTGSIDESKLDTSVNASLDLADSAIQTETDPVFTAWDKDYNDLTNKPIIPASNYASIQAALDAAETAGGGIVTLANGTHNITAALQISSNTALLGVGNVIIKRMSTANAMIINKADGTTGGYIANKNITLENITFDTNNTGYSDVCTSIAFGHANNITVKNCKVIDFDNSWHELELNGCRNVTIENCDFEYDGSAEALQLDIMLNDTVFPWFGPYDNTTNELVYIKNCRFTTSNSIGDAKAIGNHSFATNCTQNKIFITECYFNGFRYAINLQDTNDLTIDKCNFVDNVYSIYQKNESNNVSNWNITNNQCDGGYISTYTENRFFTSNENSSLNSKTNSNFNITGNNITNCYTHGIAGTFDKNINISNNKIYSNGKNGIYIFGGDNVLITGNSLYDNYKVDATRADIVVGNHSGVSSDNVNVNGNNLYKGIIGTYTTKVLFQNNFIITSLTNNGGAEGIYKDNIVAGVLQTNLDVFYPVGTIYETTSTNLDTTTKMNAHFGGTWEVFGAGRVLVAKSADTEFDTIGETGGATTHTLTVDQIPSHNHGYVSRTNGVSMGTDPALLRAAPSGGTNDFTSTVDLKGGGQAHNNLQPYIVVYRYRRTA